MLDELLSRVLGDNSFYSVREVLETDEAYCIYLSDRYGNFIDELPLCINKSSGLACDEDVSVDVELKGVECEVPLKYASYSYKAKRLLSEKWRDSARVSAVVDALFWDGCQLDEDDLYAVANYMMGLVDRYCSDEEKSSVLLMVDNERVKEFLGLDNDEKVVVAKAEEVGKESR